MVERLKVKVFYLVKFYMVVLCYICVEKWMDYKDDEYGLF